MCPNSSWKKIYKFSKRQDNISLDSMVDYFKTVELTEVNMHLLNKKARQLEETLES